jgi:prolyl oligopeptidase
MKKIFLFLILSPMLVNAQLKYPDTRKNDIVDGYFETYKVADPYRWLEDDNSSETKEWVKAENKVTDEYLSTIPFREKLRARLKELFNYTRYSAPFKKGEYYYFFKNDGLQNQSVLFRQRGMAGQPEIFLDPNTLSKEGTAALGSYTFSKSGKYFAYTIAVAGSDWQEGRVLETATGKVLTDKIEWIKFGGFSWKGDEGFYYSGYEKPEEKSKLSGQNQFNIVRFHEMGKTQLEDKLVFVDRENPFRYASVSLTEDERFAVLTVSQGTDGNEVYFLDNKSNGMIRFETLIGGFEHNNTVVDNSGGRLLVLTNDEAPNYKLVAIRTYSPREKEEEETKRRLKGYTEEQWEKMEKRENWRTILPEKKDMALQEVAACGGFLFATYLKDASSRVYQYTYEGKLVREIKLPGLGTAGGFSGERKDKELFYTFSSFNMPATIYRFELVTGKSTLFRRNEPKVRTDDLVTEQVFFKSKDGTRVPMFLTYKKGMVKNGQNPVMMYGYGGFNVALTPGFGTSNAFFIQQGGIYVSVNLRGGSEYGEKWHKAGMFEKKQNVFDDFIAAAEYLINQKYTSSQKLAISGGSNGGLLVGAVMTQRPELFKVAIPEVGVLDMLRYHKFTVGWGWAVEYGNPDSAQHFPYLYKYSPYHNLKPNTTYPATMVTTGDHDDRVVPAHSFKFAARLQEYHNGKDPVLIRVETNAGHGAGKPLSKQIDESTDIWSFVMYNLGMSFQ